MGINQTNVLRVSPSLLHDEDHVMQQKDLEQVEMTSSTAVNHTGLSTTLQVSLQNVCKTLKHLSAQCFDARQLRFQPQQAAKKGRTEWVFLSVTSR